MEHKIEEKRSTYNKQKYVKIKENILAYRTKRHRQLNADKYNIEIQDGNKGLKQTQHRSDLDFFSEIYFCLKLYGEYSLLALLVQKYKY